MIENVTKKVKMYQS